MIAGHEQRRRRRAKITDREREHSIQTLYAVRTFLLIEMNNHLGVGVGGKAMALAFEFSAKLSEVVDFSVVGDPHRAVFVAHRHVADRGEIENGKTATAQADVGTVWKLPVP